MADLPATAKAVLAEMVLGLSPEPTTASTMAVDNTQSTAWGPGRSTGGQHNSAVVQSCHP